MYQDDIFDASWERRLPMEGLGNGCYVLARLVKDEELVLEHQIPEVR